MSHLWFCAHLKHSGVSHINVMITKLEREINNQIDLDKSIVEIVIN